MIDGRIDFDFYFKNPKIYVLEIFYFLFLFEWSVQKIPAQKIEGLIDIFIKIKYLV